jgi:hypothetical protein
MYLVEGAEDNCDLNRFNRLIDAVRGAGAVE